MPSASEPWGEVVPLHGRRAGRRGDGPAEDPAVEDPAVPPAQTERRRYSPAVDGIGLTASGRSTASGLRDFGFRWFSEALCHSDSDCPPDKICVGKHCV